MTPLPLAPLGREVLDDPRCPDDVARATLLDIATSNALFGGRQAARFGLQRLLDVGGLPARPLRLLDLGAGAGDIARHLCEWSRQRGVRLKPVAVDLHREAVRLAGDTGVPGIRADVAALPLRPGSVDIVLASQFLHHFRSDAACTVLRTVDRLAAVGVVVADIRRARMAVAGIWLAAVVLGFHETTRRDGVLSVRRGYTRPELARLLKAAGIRAPVSRRPGFRLVAAWRTDRANG